MKQKVFTLLVILMIVIILPGSALASSPGPDVRLSNDFPGGGYVSAYTLATGNPYTDATLDECSRSRGRQNEPSVAVDPRNTSVIIGSSNDYCGVYNDGNDANGAPIPSGPVWLGYYRSENGGTSFQSSLVPGYPDDTSPYAALAHIRTASSGDPVIAWDTHGRVFMGSESSGDPEGTFKSFGDVWVARFDNPDGESGNTINDGKRYLGTEIIAKGSADPNFVGKFHDKTAIEADRTGGACDGYVYFAWSRFTGGPTNGFNASVYFSRSTDHGTTWSSPQKLSQTVHDIQFPDIAVTGDGHVYVTFRQFRSQLGQSDQDAVMYVKSVNCGQTFTSAQMITSFEPYDPTDLFVDGSRTTECGDFGEACQSGYTFMRGGTQVRSTADQTDKAHEWVYIVYDPSKPGTEVPSGTTFGTIVSEDLSAKYHQTQGSQAGIYFTRLDGVTGGHTAPKLIDNQATGHQIFPDISADGGFLHALWWDSRNDSCYSAARPIGNCANGTTVPSLDVYASMSTDAGNTWNSSTRVSDVTTKPTYEQFAGRTVPFGGDYLWISSVGTFSYGAWTDWRDTVPGTDLREAGDDDNDSADVLQCRTQLPSGAFTGDTCPRDGGLDQNIYGDLTP